MTLIKHFPKAFSDYFPLISVVYLALISSIYSFIEFIYFAYYKLPLNLIRFDPSKLFIETMSMSFVIIMIISFTFSLFRGTVFIYELNKTRALLGMFYIFLYTLAYFGVFIIIFKYQSDQLLLTCVVFALAYSSVLLAHYIIWTFKCIEIKLIRLFKPMLFALLPTITILIIYFFIMNFYIPTTTKEYTKYHNLKTGEECLIIQSYSDNQALCINFDFDKVEQKEGFKYVNLSSDSDYILTQHKSK